MKEKQLKSIIDRLNKGKLTEQLFVGPLYRNVDFAYYWDESPKPTMSICSGDGPYKFYLIRNEKGIYVGCVLDMTTDLHWYILPVYRKKGYLSTALRAAVLPHLFENRKEQRITIDSYHLSDKNTEDSEAVAEKLGFKAIGSMEYLLQRKDFKPKKLVHAASLGLEEERLEILRKRVNYLSRSLWQIANETETSLGSSKYSTGLEKLAEDIRKFTWKLEDASWEHEKSTTNNPH